ncbi:phage holin family protein [Bacillus alveayuensis]|uniref:NhaP-type Na+/H+ or K+/H+ antiporter n=1 Tax=Aeribacillus alveayuensis TaxID=279215 RepID=A0ABT9VKU7_9BACI|nr:phage holin family protein [Bacillus alveayuensis]MDQ0161583.1 NhaP-type Na+/H+ or K+/H+ antiporter [Bacillus alveayuensis]
MFNELFNQVVVHPQLVIVVPALMILGYALKRTPFIQNWMIVWIIIFAGILASVVTIGFSVNGIANGIIAGGAAITSYQMYKQTMEATKKNGSSD